MIQTVVNRTAVIWTVVIQTVVNRTVVICTAVVWTVVIWAVVIQTVVNWTIVIRTIYSLQRRKSFSDETKNPTEIKKWIWNIKLWMPL